MKHFILLLSLFSVLQLQAQRVFQPNEHFWEINVLLGISNYSGDLAEKNIQISETHTCFGAQVRYFLKTKWAMNMHVVTGTISGDDAHAKNIDRQKRSLRFGSNFVEIGLSGEWHFLETSRFSTIGMAKRPKFSPYLSLGVGYTFNDTRLEYYGLPQDQDKLLPASLPEMAARQHFITAPFGAGFSSPLNRYFRFGAVLSAQPTFSDKLDGVRYNGNPNKSDWYYYGGFILTYLLEKRRP